MDCGTTISITARMVAVTGHNEAYYTRLSGQTAGTDLGREVRLSVSGTALHVAGETARHAGVWVCEPAQFVTYIQNHDQIANSGRGERLHQLTSPGTLSRA